MSAHVHAAGWSCFLLLGLAGCSDTGEPTPEPTVEPTPADEASPTPPAYCATSPVITYANFGEGFMTENCQGCHASTAPERYGAPTTVTFDTLEEVQHWETRILARVFDTGNPMPPGGGISSEDKEKLKIWLNCWE